MLKKLKVLKSNNWYFGNKLNQIYENNESEKLEQLKIYVKKYFNYDNFEDPDLIFKLMGWVNQRWEHDGLNNPGKETSSLEILKRAEKGEKFRCVEYGRVTADILTSLGYVSRSIGIRSENADYGGAGMGHVATEVWSNYYEKWIFIDPQFSCYYLRKDIPQNYYEIYESWKQGKIEELNFMVVEDALKREEKNKEEYKKNYEQFLFSYFGYIEITKKEEEKLFKVSLILDGKNQLMAFQAGPIQSTIYTKKTDVLYEEVNRTFLTFESTEKIDFMNIAMENQIDTQEKFIANMELFTVKPKYKVECKNNMPNFSHYEISIDKEKWCKIEEDYFLWEANKGENIIQVRGINKQGLPGIITEITLEYK